MNIDPSKHTQFLSGYMDAVGRVLTNNSDLCCLTARVVESIKTLEKELDCEIVETDDVENITLDFERGIKIIFGVEPRERLFFYLTDYVMWFAEYTSSCKAVRIEVTGKKIASDHLAWLLTLNENIGVFICISKQAKNA